MQLKGDKWYVGEIKGVFVNNQSINTNNVGKEGEKGEWRWWRGETEIERGCRQKRGRGRILFFRMTTVHV